MTEAACCVWDFTLSAKHYDVEGVKNYMKKYCKKWTFQEELGGKSGYNHFQGRMSLKVKTRLNGVIKIFGSKGHYSVTSNENRDNNFYVIKEDTRVNGPWSDTDGYIPKHLDAVNPKWYKWQQSVVDSLKCEPDSRTINVIYDQIGNQGKSYLASWHACRGLARKIPMCNDMKEVMQIVFDMPASRAYFLDMPRGQDERSMHNIISAFEEVKNGHCFDTRYHYRERWQDTSHIWIFTNSLPKLKLLSADRWRIYQIEDSELIPYDPQGIDVLTDSSATHDDYSESSTLSL